MGQVVLGCQGDLGERLVRNRGFQALGFVESIPGFVNSVTNLAVRPVARALGSNFEFKEHGIFTDHLATDRCDATAATIGKVTGDLAALAPVGLPLAAAGLRVVKSGISLRAEVKVAASAEAGLVDAKSVTPPALALPELGASLTPAQRAEYLAKAEADYGPGLRDLKPPRQPGPREEIHPPDPNPIITGLDNDATLKQLETLPAAGSPSATPAQLDAILQTVRNSDVTKLSALKKYFLEDMGMCYGRAYSVFIEAQRAHIPKTAMRRVWVTGRPSGDPSWRFHTATAVRDGDNKWWVVDPLFAKPQALRDWTKAITDASGYGASRLTFTEPTRISYLGSSLRTTGLRAREVVSDPSRPDYRYWQDLLKESRARGAQ